MPAVYDEPRRVIVAQPLYRVRLPHEFQWRRSEVDTPDEYGAWQSAGVSPSRVIEIPVDNVGGVYQVRVRVIYDAGEPGRWAFMQTVSADPLPVLTNVELDPETGCPDVSNLPEGVRISWDTPTQRYTGVVGKPWTEAVTGVNTGIPWRVSGLNINYVGFVPFWDANDPIVLSGPRSDRQKGPIWAVARPNPPPGTGFRAGYYQSATLDPGAAGWDLNAISNRLADMKVGVRCEFMYKRGVMFWSHAVITKVGSWFSHVPSFAFYIRGDIFTDPRAIEADGTSIAQYFDAGVQFDADGEVSLFRVRFRVGSELPGAAGPSLRTPLDQWALAMEFDGDGVFHHFDIPTTDLVEPYRWTAAELPASLVTRLKRIKTDSDAGRSLGRFTIGLIKKSEWTGASDYSGFQLYAPDETWFQKTTPNHQPTDEQRDWRWRTQPSWGVATRNVTVAVFDGERRCPADPLLNVEVEPDDQSTSREDLFTVADGVNIPADRRPLDAWLVGEGVGKRLPERGDPANAYVGRPNVAALPENSILLWFYRDYTEQEKRLYQQPADGWNGPIPLLQPGQTQAHCYRAGTADVEPAISGSGPVPPVGWSLFAPSSTPANPRVWEAVTALVGGSWTAWDVIPAVGAANPVVYLTQAQYDALAVKAADTEYNIYD